MKDYADARRRLLDHIARLTEAQYAHLEFHFPQAALWVPKGVAPMERAAALLRYQESTPGQGLHTLAAYLLDPNIQAADAAEILRILQARASEQNPYFHDAPVPPTRLAGRKSTLRQMERLIAKGSHLELCGAPRIGQTSLMLAYKHELDLQKHKTAYVAISDRGSWSPGRLARAITGAPIADDSTPTAATDHIGVWASSHATGARPPVVFLDRLDRGLQTLGEVFLTNLRGYLEHGKLQLIISTRTRLSRLCKGLWGSASPFDGVISYLNLNLLDEDGFDELCAWSEGQFEPEDIRLLREQAGLHPLMLQMLACQLVMSRQIGGSVDDAKHQFYTNLSPYLEDLFDNYISEKSKEYILKNIESDNLSRSELVSTGLLTTSGRLASEGLRTWLREQ